MASGRLIIPLAEPALTALGAVAGGATLTVYNTGTTTLSAIYADAALTTPITNPQVANSAGRFVVQTDVIWADAGSAYDIVLGFPDGSSLTFDQIYLLGAATNVSGFAPINSPVFTGTPQAPTPATNDNSANIATTAYVQAQNYATSISPNLSGTPTTPTPSTSADNTQIASTAFVYNLLNALTVPGSEYVRFGSGTNSVYLMWGQTGSIGGGSTATVTISAPLSSTVQAVVITAATGGSSAQVTNIAYGFSPTGFTVKNNGNTSTIFSYIAIGQ